MSGSNASDLIGKSPDRRKLIAVVYADMVGYSRLIGLDDAGTLERLRTLRREVIDPAIDEHGGRIVQTGGDSLLIVFDSIDGAVRCAVKVQEHVPIHDGDQPPDRAIRFRIGINIGDAIADGTDLHGDSVNVAVRLQAECPPAGICVTRPVRDHVQDRLNLTFEELGALSLKNIARPVEAFVVRCDPPVTSESVECSLVHGTNVGLPLPDKPSIAVLAFTNMSGDPEQEYFSDGIADEIITELSRSRSLFVIARNSSFTYKGRAVDIKQVARELGVRYVLEGSVRRSSDRVRVIAQLVDAGSSNHIWADRYDRAVQDVFAVQDEITTAVVIAIQPAVAEAEHRRVLRKSPSNLNAWETYQQGLWYLAKGTPADNQQARNLFQQGAALDRSFASSFIGLARTYAWDAFFHGIRTYAEAAKLTEREVRRALTLDQDDPEAHTVLAEAFALSGDMSAAMVAIERGLDLNRNSAEAHWQKAAFLTYGGRPTEGRREALTTLRLNPRGLFSPVTWGVIIASYYFERDYAGVVEVGRRFLIDYPHYARPRRFIIAALGQLGRQEEAAAALRQWMTDAPIVSKFVVSTCPPWMRPEDHEHMLDGLRKARWPD
jgi:adenylate cyclase